MIGVIGSTVAGYFAGPMLVDLVLRAKIENDTIRRIAAPIAHAQYDFVASIAVSVGAYLLLGVIL